MSKSFDLPLVVTSPVHATATTPGINRITWDLPIVWNSSPPIGDSVLVSYNYRRLYLQRSVSANNIELNIEGRHVYTNTVGVPLVDGRWITIRAWENAELPGGADNAADPSTFPVTYDDSVEHTTYYNYRLIFIGRPSATAGVYKHVNWNSATVVQPGVMSICKQASCYGSPTPTNPDATRVRWDAPLFVDDHFNFFVGRSTNHRWEVRWSWPFTAQPDSWTLRKSWDGGSTYLTAKTFNSISEQPFYDDDTHQTPVFFKLIANTPDGATSTYDVQQGP